MHQGQIINVLISFKKRIVNLIFTQCLRYKVLEYKINTCIHEYPQKTFGCSDEIIVALQL